MNRNGHEHTGDRLRIVAAEPIAGRDDPTTTDWYRHGGPLVKYPVRMFLSRNLSRGEWALLKRVRGTTFYRSVDVLSAKTIEVVTTIETVKDKPEIFQAILDRVVEQVERRDIAPQLAAAELEEQLRREAIAKDIPFS
jgi:hypothetical protein